MRIIDKEKIILKSHLSERLSTEKRNVKFYF